MRKSSKAVSLLLSGLLATSCFSMAAVSASAATADSEETGVMTAQERIDAGHQIVFFQFPDTAWGDNANVKYNKKKHTCNVFCSYYAIYGNQNEVKERSWEAPSTSMYKDSADSSLYYFDITESGQGEMEEGATYGILFSTKANAGQADLLQPNTDGFQTCDLYFDTTCLGDTFSIDIPVATRENTANSQKIDYRAHSSNGVSGSLKKVSSLCAYIDGMDPGNAPKSVELANRLQSYLPNPVNEPSFTWAKIEPLLPKLGTTAQEVYDMYVEKFSDKLAEGVPYEPVGDGSDLKPDGTLKDVYRYVSITTTEIDEATGIAKEKVTKYPTLDLVRERLNLPDQPVVEPIDAAHVSVNDALIAVGEEIPDAIAPAGAPYSVVTGWDTEDTVFEYDKTYTLTAEFTANEGYEFTDDTTVSLDNVGEGSVAFVQTSEINDGKLIAKFAFEMGSAPVVEDTFVVAGSEAEIFGTAWDAGNEDNLMTKNADGKYEITYTVDKAFTDVIQLKVVKNGSEWIGDSTGNNVMFYVTGAGDFTVAIDPETNEITVTGDNINPDITFEYDTVFAVGNGEGAWLNGAAWDPAYAANEMTEVAEDVWEIEFPDVPDGFERQVKFAIDGAWTHNFGGVFEESGVQSDAVYNGDNITFDTEEDTQTIKLQLDLSEFDFVSKEGAKFTLTIESGEPVEAVGIIGDVDGDGEVTVDDATLIQQRGIELIEFDEVQEQLGDVNRDGRVSILDVTCVQKYVAEYLDDGIGMAGAILLADGRIVPAN